MNHSTSLYDESEDLPPLEREGKDVPVLEKAQKRRTRRREGKNGDKGGKDNKHQGKSKRTILQTKVKVEVNHGDDDEQKVATPAPAQGLVFEDLSTGSIVPNPHAPAPFQIQEKVQATDVDAYDYDDVRVMEMQRQQREREERERRLNKQASGPPVRELQQWFHTTRYFSRSKTDAGMTHSIMSGGVLNVPFTENRQMWALIRNDALNVTLAHPYGLRYAISETLVLRPDQKEDEVLVYAFAEFDAPKGEGWSDVYQRSIGGIFALTLKQFLLRAPDNKVKKEPGSSGGTNNNNKHSAAKFHVYISSKVDLVNTDKEEANIHLQTKVCVKVSALRLIYNMFIDNLKKRTDLIAPRLPNQLKWSMVLDTQVVQDRKVNLRMNGSIKVVNCECQKMRKKVLGPWICDAGCKDGRLEVPSVYQVCQVVDQDGNLDDEEFARIHASMVSELEACSILPGPTVKEHPLYLCPEYVPMEEQGSRKDPKTGLRMEIKNRSSRMAEQAADLKSAGQKKMWSTAYDVPRDHPIFTVACDVMHTAIKPEWYSRVEVTKVLCLYNPQTKVRRYRLRMKGEGANICHNRTPDTPDSLPCHRSMNRIGIDIDIDGWSQWCMAGNKLDQRNSNTPCSRFRSPKVRLPDACVKALFHFAEDVDAVTMMPDITRTLVSVPILTSTELPDDPVVAAAAEKAAREKRTAALLELAQRDKKGYQEQIAKSAVVAPERMLELRLNAKQMMIEANRKIQMEIARKESVKAQKARELSGQTDLSDAETVYAKLLFDVEEKKRKEEEEIRAAAALAEAAEKATVQESRKKRKIQHEENAKKKAESKPIVKSALLLRQEAAFASRRLQLNEVLEGYRTPEFLAQLYGVEGMANKMHRSLIKKKPSTIQSFPSQPKVTKTPTTTTEELPTKSEQRPYPHPMEQC